MCFRAVDRKAFEDSFSDYRYGIERQAKLFRTRCKRVPKENQKVPIQPHFG